MIDIFLQVLLLLVGFVLLVKGADWFIDGAAGIAAKLKISSFIIGLTIVAVGTSTPEAATSILGALQGSDGTAIGNIIGSNIVNIFLILGVCALITNIPVEKSSRVVELPFLVLTTALFILLGVMGTSFVWWEGIILLVLYILFMVYTIVMAKRTKPALIEQASVESVAVESAPVEQKTYKFKWMQTIASKYEELKAFSWFLVVITIIGLVIVVLGANLVVNAATFIAGKMGIPEMVIGLTVVAFGTSLPEFITSVTAAKKGDMGIATGNIIGSNIANLLLIGGLSFICTGANPLPVSPTMFVIDCAVSILAAVVLWAFSMGKTKSLGKIAGVSMILILVAYYAYLFLLSYEVIVF